MSAQCTVPDPAAQISVEAESPVRRERLKRGVDDTYKKEFRANLSVGRKIFLLSARLLLSTGVEAKQRPEKGCGALG